MRTFLEILLIVVLAALSLWAGLPWPIVFAVALLLACGLRLFSFTKGEKADPGLFFALAAFLGLGLLISWLIHYTVFSTGEGGTVFIASRDLLKTDFSRTFWSLVFGFVLAAVFCVPLLLPLSFIGARIIYGAYDQYKGHELEAMFSLIRSVLGMSKGTMLVKGGTVQVTNGKEEDLKRFGGPGTLIIQEGHAVILEKSGALSRIVGRGTNQLGKFERVSAVVDLTPKSQALEEENVVTKDGVSLDKVQAVVFYKVVPGDPYNPGYRENGRYPFDEDVVYKFWSTTGEQTWQNSVKAIAKAALRDVVAKFTLDQIFTDADEFRKKVKGDKEQVPTTDEFRGDLCNYINKTTELLGVRVTAADIGDIQLPADAKQRLMDKWMAEAERQVAIVRGQAETTTFTTHEMARAAAQSEMIAKISEAIKQTRGEDEQGKDEQVELDKIIEQTVRLRLIEALEKMATEHASGFFLPNDFLAWLSPDRNLRGGVGGKPGPGVGGSDGGSSPDRPSVGGQPS